MPGRRCDGRARQVVARAGRYLHVYEGAACLISSGEKLREFVHIVAAHDARITAGGGDAGKVGAGADRRLRASRIVGFVVEHQVREVRRVVGADGGKIAHAHERGAIAVHHQHAQIGARERQAETQGRRAAHRADHVEMLGPVGQGV